MSDFSSRFREARLSAGLSINTIAQRLGVSKQSVYGWETGSIPKAARIEELSSLLGVDLHWLTFGESSAHSVRDEDGDLVVPLLDTITSAGYSGSESSGRVVSLMKIDPQWARSNLRITSAKSVAMIAVTGDSMTPTLESGAMVIVDTAVSTVDADAIYVVRISGSDFIKRFQRIPGGKLLMISDNPKYREMEVDPAEGDFSVLGRAVFVWHGTALF